MFCAFIVAEWTGVESESTGEQRGFDEGEYVGCNQ